MVQDSEYKVLSEQIRGLTTLINAQFLEVHERLDKINGKVAKHDEQITEALIERARNRQEQKAIIPEHILTCPVSRDIIDFKKDFSAFKKTLEDLNFFVRHPKLFIGTLVVIVILTLATFLENSPLKIFSKYTTPTTIEQTK